MIDELDALPDEMVDGLENVAFVIEDEPEDGEDLLGRYEGVDLTHRGRYGFGELPDRIVVFRLPHLAAWTPRRSCATRSTPRSCTRSATSTASTTTACTSSGGPEAGRRITVLTSVMLILPRCTAAL